MVKSSTKKKTRTAPPLGNPVKPTKTLDYPEDYPLGPANNGRWQKKIAGKLHYFGAWGKMVGGKMERLPGCGWVEALRLFKDQIDDLRLGRKPRVKNQEGLTVGELRARFLTAKSRSLDAGEITARTYSEYRATADRLQATFGDNRLVADLASDDFEDLRAEIAKQWGPVRLGNEVQRVRCLFKYGYESGLIDKPVRFGPTFKRPSRKVLRKNRKASGKKFFDAAEIRAMLDVADPQLKAMILLAVNIGFGNTDCALLPQSAVNLKTGWIEFPRPKTGIDRRCPLWPETVTAIKEAIATRPDPKDPVDADLVFVTKYGKRWVRTVEKKKGNNPDEKPKLIQLDAVPHEFAKVLDTLKIVRKGAGFYALRHVFRTIADGAKDRPSARAIMGHAPKDSDEAIDDAYNEGINDSRLRAVVDHVWAWLFPTSPAKEGVA